MLNEKEKIFDYESAYKSLTSKLLTHERRLLCLDKNTEGAFNNMAIPNRPRYIMLDYAKFVNEGSIFLNVRPPKNLEAYGEEYGYRSC